MKPCFITFCLENQYVINSGLFFYSFLYRTQVNNKFSEKYQIIESALSHVKQGTKGIYDKAEHFQERVDLMQWWADYVYSLS